jgi:hypothetical protein
MYEFASLNEYDWWVHDDDDDGQHEPYEPVAIAMYSIADEVKHGMEVDHKRPNEGKKQKLPYDIHHVEYHLVKHCCLCEFELMRLELQNPSCCFDDGERESMNCCRHP